MLGVCIKEGTALGTKTCWPWLSQDMIFFVDVLPSTSLDAGEDNLAVQPLLNTLSNQCFRPIL